MENTIDNAIAFINKHIKDNERTSERPYFEAAVAYAASVKPDGWRVRGLEWERDGMVEYSDTIIGTYKIVFRISENKFFITTPCDKIDLSKPFDSFDLAKAAAEADYMERLGAALEPV